MMKTKKMFSILLTLAMVLSLGAVTAFADEDPNAFDINKVFLTKDFEAADGIDISDFNSFTFSFTAEESTTVEKADHPAIADKDVTVSTQSGGHAYGSLGLSTIFNENDFLKYNFTDSSKKVHAGEYVYIVKETSSGNAKITYDKSEYKVHVYVENDDNDLKIADVKVGKIADEKGAALPQEQKVDPTIEEGKNTGGFNFKNSYKDEVEKESGVLTVTKTVTGAYGDKTKQFPVTVTLTIPSTASASDVAVKDGTVADNGNSTVTFTKSLAHDDSIVFTKLPAGTTFKVEETQDANYDGKIEGDLITEQSFAAGVDVSATSTGPIVDVNGKTVTLTNNRDSVTNTGIIINNLPYILMVAIAGLGAAYIILKKKRTNN